MRVYIFIYALDTEAKISPNFEENEAYDSYVIVSSPKVESAGERAIVQSICGARVTVNDRRLASRCGVVSSESSNVNLI